MKYEDFFTHVFPTVIWQWDEMKAIKPTCIHTGIQKRLQY